MRGPVDKFDYFWTDGSAELKECFKALNIPHDTSLSGRTQNNSRAERSVRHVVEGARSLLLAAGLPTAYWPHAVRYFALCCNARTLKERNSPWFARFLRGLQFC